jgi:hypothetical protein
MRVALAIAAAIPCLLVSTALLGFINLATYEAVSSWGITEAIAEITGTTWNISVFVGCWVIGLASLWAGLSAIYRRPLWPFQLSMVRLIVSPSD